METTRKKVEAKPTLFISDRRMLELLDFCVANEVQGIVSARAWCAAIDFGETGLAKVRNGIRGFTVEHLFTAAQVFGVSLDWIFGFSPEMFRATSNPDPIRQLEAAVASVRSAFQGKRSRERVR